MVIKVTLVAEPNATALKNLSVHIVEDEIIIALDLEDILGDLGHRVDVSYTIEDAMEKAADTTVPDLFVIDINLRGADSGITLGKELQQRNIPHIYISAYTDEETRALAESTASLGFLSKPFSEKEFKAALRGAADQMNKTIPPDI